LEATTFTQRDAAMQFSVIYSADCPADEDINDFAPPNLDLWDQTEDDDQYDYGDLEGRWANGHHRKWCAILSREQFTEFVEHCGMFAEDVETMGSLGAPGFGFGWAPAISFRADDPDAFQSAYVTPLPGTGREQCDENDWGRVRGAVLAVYA
jgi:hypothetical protein